MTLVNALGAIALDSTVQDVKTAVDAVTTTLDNGVTISGTVSTGLSQPLTDSQLRATAVQVSGTVDLGSTSLSALENITATISGSVPVTGTFWQATQPVSVSSLPLPSGAATQTTLAAIDTKLGSTLAVSTGLSQPLTDTQLRATAVPVSGTVELGSTSLSALENITASVSGTVPISATSMPLPSGAATAANQTSGNASLSSIDAKLSGNLNVSTGLTQPLTDAELRASAIPVIVSSGIEISNDIGNPIPVNGTVEIGVTSLSALENVQATISGTVPISAIDLPLPTGAATDAMIETLSNILQSQKDLQQEIKNLTDTMVVLLSAMFERMPRVTGNDQMTVSIEAGSVGISSNQDIRTVSTVSNVNTVGSKYVSGDNLNLSGVAHIYNNIEVS